MRPPYEVGHVSPPYDIRGKWAVVETVSRKTICWCDYRHVAEKIAEVMSLQFPKGTG